MTSSAVGQVQTVRGRVDPAALGRTLMHEHLVTINALVEVNRQVGPRRLLEVTGAS